MKKPFKVWHACRHLSTCSQEKFSDTHLQGSYWTPWAAYRRLRALRKEFYASKYFMTFGRVR